METACIRLRLMAHGFLQPPQNHKRKQWCLPMNLAGFIKCVFWFEAKPCSVVLSLFIPVFHSLYQLLKSELRAVRGLSHTNSTFISSQIYNQATNPPISLPRLLKKKGLHKGNLVIILSIPQMLFWMMDTCECLKRAQSCCFPNGRLLGKWTLTSMLPYEKQIHVRFDAICLRMISALKIWWF